MRSFTIFLIILLLTACSNHEETSNLKLWYNQPAETWTDALPVGNGRLGAMVHGGVAKEYIQFNEETLWKGGPHDYAHKGAVDYLGDIRKLILDGKQQEAQKLAMDEFMSTPLTQMEYQPFGDLYFEFPGHEDYSNYYRELDIEKAVCKISYSVNDIGFTREVIASYPKQLIAINIEADKAKSLSFAVYMDTNHEIKSLSTQENTQILQVAVKDGKLRGTAGIKVESDGIISNNNDKIIVENAKSATILLSASTNFISYKDISKDPLASMQNVLKASDGLSYKVLKDNHIDDYQSLFKRFSIDFGTNGRDSLPTDQRLEHFIESPEDPSLISLYTQFGRYLLISSSRPGTQPANLQGIWNKDLDPAWGSKYTTNINTEMNYWPAELTNLSECHEPLFSLIEDCSETGINVAKEHYGAEGWILHHNTDLWRGTAPINHSNHGIWLGGSGWLSSHLWEHYLFTQDRTFLEKRAYPVMKGAAVFYTQVLIEDPNTGWLISTPSNSPEIGGLVAGPTMDHQIIRSLFKSCVEASEILDTDPEFRSQLMTLIPEIAPNQIGKYGQLQEWLEDVDDPKVKHRHVSHLWGMHPGKDITWEKSPELMEAARQSLLFRGDEGTGWSLSWKINFWARFKDGDHAYELIKLLFRPVSSSNTKYMGGGGSYANLFDAHPPFQVDGNFGAPAGIVEMFIQSHQSVIVILPALPSALPNGQISGVCARGGFELSFSWENGKLKNLKVLSKAGKACKIRYREEIFELETLVDQTYILDQEIQNMLN